MMGLTLNKGGGKYHTVQVSCIRRVSHLAKRKTVNHNVPKNKMGVLE